MPRSERLSSAHVPAGIAARTVRRFLLCALFATTVASAQSLTVTLVGTGGPELTPGRSGIATVIASGPQTILVDAGRNTLSNVRRARLDPNTITTIFLTHLHSDHIDGLADLWITPWFLLHRSTPLAIYGPPGTQSMIDGLRLMYAHDIEYRANPSSPRAGLDITVHELAGGDTIDFAPLHITATQVEHADGNPAFAYRVADSAHTVLLTGDCTLTPSLLAAARSAEVIIANVAAGTPAQEALPQWKPVFAKLLTPAQAAQLFRSAHPKLAVYSHIVTKGAVSDALLAARTRSAGYRGRLLVGQDATRITIAGTIVIERIAPPHKSLDGVTSAP